MAEAWLYDGRSAVRRGAHVQASAGGLHVAPVGGEAFLVAADDLAHVETRADVDVYGRTSVPGWRLGILRPVPEDVAALLPSEAVYGRLIDRIGLGKALIAGGIVSATILTLGYFAPRWLAPAVPVSWERQFGAALVGDLDENVCSGAEGQQALDNMARQLSPSASSYKVRVVNVPMVNAIALPGGNILLFRPLIQEANEPDEVAGILAHEIAHIEKRHTTEAMIRHYGLSMIMVAFGGTTGANVDTIASAGYSRRAEREADLEAIAALHRAAISPKATADFFARLAKIEGESWLDTPVGYISTHPPSRDRRQQFEAAARPGRRYIVSLDDMEWQALRDICGFRR